MNNTIGRCSICGGDVVIPMHWSAVVPPVPTCTSCGATKRRRLPTVEMEPPRDVSIPDFLRPKEAP